jgi:hypothetical protein
MKEKNDMLNFVLEFYGDIIKDYIGYNIGISFYNNIENFLDSIENIKSTLRYTRDTDVKKPFITTLYADYSLGRDIKITDCMLGTIKNKEKEYKILKFMTPFTISDTYDFIIFNNSEANEIFSILEKRKAVNNFTFDLDKNPIIGIDLEDIKTNTIDFLLNEEFRTYCQEHFIKLKRGLILSGKPGTGKSITLKYLKNVALSNNIYYYSFQDGKDFFNRQTDFYNDDKKIFVFEDFDTLLREREDTNNSPNQLLGSILNTLDGINEINNVISIFTTNKIGLFDSAFIRPGRIDKVYNYELPTEKTQLEFFKIYIPEEELFFNIIISTIKSINADTSFAVLKGICDDINILKFYKVALTEKVIVDVVSKKLHATAKNKSNSVEKYIL